MRTLLSICFLGLSCVTARAQGPVLIQEVISRETSIFIGEDNPSGQVLSREITVFIGENANGKEVISREISLVRSDATPPPKVTGLVVTVSPTGHTVTLAWPSYNPWAVRDVASFAIYYSSTPFTDVSGMTPYRSVSPDELSIALTGLPEWQDHFFAVVAVDALGNRDPAVVYSAAYVVMPQVVSREVTIFVGQETGADLKQIVSRETSLVMVDGAAPPSVTTTVTTVSPDGSGVTLSWSTYNPHAVRDVSEFRIYRSASPFGSISGLTPAAVVSGETLGLTSGQGERKSP